MTRPYEEILHEVGTCPEVFEMATTPGRAFILLGQIQLALRHPHNTGPGAAYAREMADHLTDAICHFVPDARELIEQGWNPGYDVTREYYDREFPVYQPTEDNG